MELVTMLPFQRESLKLLVGFSLAFLGIWMLLSRRKEKALPGPRGLPWLGPLWDVDAQHMWLTFYKWSRKYGPIYEVNLLGQNYVCLSDQNYARELLASKMASSRPSIANVHGSKDSGHYLPFLGYNEIWKKQRRFGASVANHTYKVEYHQVLEPETLRLLSELLKGEYSYDTAIYHYFSRISCRMAWGTTAPAVAVTNSMQKLMRNLSPAGRVTNSLPFLRHLPEFFSYERKEERKRRDEEFRLWHGLFHQARLQRDSGTLPDCYVSQYFENVDQYDLGMEHAVHGVGMMATVAILTLATPLGWLIIAMTLHPQWMRAVQDELDHNIGDRMLTLADSPRLPILRAVIVESLRWHPVVPTGIPHQLEEDVTWRGYRLRRGTNIMAVDWSMSRDPILYPDPEKFNPGRWLDVNYPTYKEPLSEYPKVNGLHGFGYGRRVCIGQDHAASALLVAAGAILGIFDLQPAIVSSGVRAPIFVEAATGFVIPAPQPQPIQFIPRSAERIDLMEKLCGRTRP